MLHTVRHWLLLTLCCLLASCEHTIADATLPPLPPLRDTCTSPYLTFESGIKPIFERHCNRCHGSVNASKGIRFDDYFAAKVFAGDDTTRFLCVINQRPNCLAMPLGGKLDSCSVQKLQTWVRRGLPER